MSEKPFKASNGWTVQKCKAIPQVMEVREADGPFVESIGPISFKTLREYFRHERDTELGRVRWPESPDVVIYRDESEDDSAGRCIKVFREDTAAFTYFWEKQRSHPDPVREAATRWYFTEGPGKEPEHPWREAETGEVWRLTVNGEEQNALADKDPGEAWFSTRDDYIRATDPYITAGRKLLNADGSMADDQD